MPSRIAAASSYRETARIAVLFAAFLGLLFDGFELGLMPVASRSVVQSLIGTNYTEIDNVRWFARFTAALMLGAAVGGSLLGNLGDRIGRARAMGVSVLIYSVFAGLGTWVTSCKRCWCCVFWWAWASAACGPMALPWSPRAGPTPRGRPLRESSEPESMSVSSDFPKSAATRQSRPIPGVGSSRWP